MGGDDAFSSTRETERWGRERNGLGWVGDGGRGGRDVVVGGEGEDEMMKRSGRACVLGLDWIGSDWIGLVGLDWSFGGAPRG